MQDNTAPSRPALAIAALPMLVFALNTAGSAHAQGWERVDQFGDLGIAICAPIDDPTDPEVSECWSITCSAQLGLVHRHFTYGGFAAEYEMRIVVDGDIAASLTMRGTSLAPDIGHATFDPARERALFERFASAETMVLDVGPGMRFGYTSIPIPLDGSDWALEHLLSVCAGDPALGQ